MMIKAAVKKVMMTDATKESFWGALDFIETIVTNY